MTSACELFSRRSRPLFRNRDPVTQVSVDPSLSSDLQRCRRRRRPVRRLRRRGLEEEQKFLQSDTRSPNNSSTGDNDDSGTIRNRVNQLTLIRSGQGNERLPGTVLQARARLLERLHGISLAESRQSIWAFNMSHNDSNGENDFGITDSREWEIETLQEWIESDVRFTDTAVDANQPVSLHDICKQKPLGLSLKTIYSLPQENFEDGQENESVLRASLECAICLERFQAGDRLLRLPCCHRFHPSCLEPWLQNFGDCPYCRASVKIC